MKSSTSWIVGTGVSSMMLFFIATGVLAETAPASKCVTKATTATHTSYVVRMEKDIASYQAKVDAADAIKKYQESLTTAWEAMKEPYCGFGAYGSKSAVKSYAKSVERARLAFLEAVKKVGKATVVASATVTSTKLVVDVPKMTPTALPKVVAAPILGANSSITIRPGLKFGMRSDAVLAMQKRLLKHFGSRMDTAFVTGYFGPKTKEFLTTFQLEKKIVSSSDEAGAGTVGPRTAAALNSL